jgi:hypothetical protein
MSYVCFQSPVGAKAHGNMLAGQLVLRFSHDLSIACPRERLLQPRVPCATRGERWPFNRLPARKLMPLRHVELIQFVKKLSIAGLRENLCHLRSTRPVSPPSAVNRRAARKRIATLTQRSAAHSRTTTFNRRVARKRIATDLRRRQSNTDELFQSPGREKTHCNARIWKPPGAACSSFNRRAARKLIATQSRPLSKQFDRTFDRPSARKGTTPARMPTWLSLLSELSTAWPRESYCNGKWPLSPSVPGPLSSPWLRENSLQHNEFLRNTQVM